MSLWIGAVFVGAMALFPNYVGALVGNGASVSPAARAGTRLTVQVEGMSCAGCEAAVRTLVSKVPGVRAVEADHETGTVAVTLSGDSDELRERIVQALEKGGYPVVGRVVQTGRKKGE
ncbi:MAG: cation transporter [Planctomycetota bacterium]|nr:MAG: cation transporter [Planctomycetota bacterium]